MWEIWSFLNWCFETLKHGTRPTKRHDDKPWEPKDDLRQSKAGAKSIKGVLIDLKSDWAEYGGTMGLPIWNDNRRPCFGCNCNPRTMNATNGIHAANQSGDQMKKKITSIIANYAKSKSM